MIRKLTGLTLLEWLFIPFLMLGNLPLIVRDMWISRKCKGKSEVK